jgi:hypothetical protein
LVQATLQRVGQASMQMTNLDILLCDWICSDPCYAYETNVIRTRMGVLLVPLQTMGMANGILRRPFAHPMRSLKHNLHNKYD